MQNVEKNKEIIDRLNKLLDEDFFIQKCDLSDLGNFIGIAIGPYVDGELGYELSDFMSGIDHGIDMVKNHSKYLDLGD